jgi:tRNA (guanosine-2'-O-)-methyltransferase
MCVHWVADPLDWLVAERANGSRILAAELLDEAVEIPVIGTGHSLNVAVAGTLIPYKLAGLV